LVFDKEYPVRQTYLLHGKNNFTELSKNLARYTERILLKNLKI